MKKLLLIAIAILGISTAQAQDLPEIIKGTRTLSIIQVPRFSKDAPVVYTAFIMGTNQYNKASAVNALTHPYTVLGTTIELGEIYIIQIIDSKITTITKTIKS